MAYYHVDSSAIVKRYVCETGSEWIKSLSHPDSRNQISLVTITKVEVASAFSRRCREGTVTEKERDRWLNTFLFDCSNQYRLIEVNTIMIDLAIELTKRYALRAYDVVQLSAALIINRALLARGLASLTFVSADDRLCSAGLAEGLSVENPNLYM